MGLKLPLLTFPLRSFVIFGILRAIMVLLVVVTISLKRMGSDVQSDKLIATRLDECPMNLSSKSDIHLKWVSKPSLRLTFPPFWADIRSLKERKDLTFNVFTYLMGKNLLQSTARALCVGEGSSSAVSSLRNLGVSESFGVDKHAYFSLFKRKFLYELCYKDEHFDFVFSANLDRVCLPALVVMEIERVLISGGIGVLLVANHYSENMANSAATFTSFLKSSDVIDSCSIGSYSLLIFRKRTEALASFSHFQLPDDCPSIVMNKPFMKYIEPLAGLSSNQEISHLPKFMNISSRNGLVYINIGAGEYARSSIQKISKLYQFNRNTSFDKFVVHYIPSITYTYVPEPGINLILYRPPGEESSSFVPEFVSEDEMDEFMDEEEFDLLRWFKETVSGGKFVILMMNARMVELNILEELYRNGAICYVDELFLHCPDAAGCTTTLETLRRSGVYAHQQFI